MKINTPYITRLHPITPIELREISELQYTEYKANCELITKFDYYQRRLREIELNIKAFFEVKEYYTDLLLKNDSLKIENDFKREGFIDLNRTFINIITSFRSFTEHCEKKVIKIFGEESKEFLEFKTVLRNLHSKNLVYKLFDALRNYSVHVGYPIEFVNFDKIKFDFTGQDCWFEVGIFFSKAKFQENEAIRNKLKTDMNLLEDNTAVEPLINKLMPIVYVILKDFIRIAKKEYISAANEILKLSEEVGFSNIGLTKSVINRYRIDGKTIIIPFSTAKELIELAT